MAILESLCQKMCSKSLTLRRNQALKHRYELKDDQKSHSATLMIKRAGERKYRAEKEY